MIWWTLIFQDFLVNPLHLYITKEWRVWDSIWHKGTSLISPFCRSPVVHWTDEQQTCRNKPTHCTSLSAARAVRRLLAELTDGWEDPWKWDLHSANTHTQRIMSGQVVRGGRISLSSHWSTVRSFCLEDKFWWLGYYKSEWQLEIVWGWEVILNLVGIHLTFQKKYKNPLFMNPRGLVQPFSLNTLIMVNKCK